MMPTLPLHHRSWAAENPAADGPHLVILHGLLGSSRNWIKAAGILAQYRPVHALDLRNHGDSPHAAEMTYAAMVEDVLHWLATHLPEQRVILMGHSLGGKVAMQLACRYPQWLEALIVLDIAPIPYPPRWQDAFDGMLTLPTENLQKRSEADSLLAGRVADWGLRQFLLTNLERSPDGQGFRWTVNLPVLARHQPALMASSLDTTDRYEGPTLFINGARSDFVPDSAQPVIAGHFPQARLITLADAGHNVHFDQPEAFSAQVQHFIDEL